MISIDDLKNLQEAKNYIITLEKKISDLEYILSDKE